MSNVPTPSPRTSESTTDGGQWFVCSVNQTGPIENNGLYTMLTDTGGKFMNTWFYVGPSGAPLFLEAALAALTSGKQVYVELTGTQPASSILRLHVIA